MSDSARPGQSVGFTDLPEWSRTWAAARLDQHTQAGHKVSRLQWTGLRDWLASLPTQRPKVVTGSLSLRGCTALSGLPDNMKIEHSVRLDGCSGLRQLPSGMVVKGALYLAGCTGLESMPADLQANAIRGADHLSSALQGPRN